MAFYVLGLDDNGTAELANAIVTAHEKIHQCKICRNLTEDEICPICSNEKRDRSTICVVESPRDVIAFERTHEYRGLYHVLHGVISPMNGIGPADLEIASLVERVKQGSIDEIIFALSPNMEGDTTAFYLFRKLADYDCKITTIARGVAIGDELEYADEVTLGRSIRNRISFSTYNTPT